MSLGTLTIDLAANVAGLESDLGKAQRIFDKNARDFQRTAVGIAKVTAGVATAVSVGFAAMVKSSIDTADQLSKASGIYGIAIEDLSALRHGAGLSGVSFDQLGAGLNKFNKQVTDAFEGVGAGAEVFDALGISVTTSGGALKENYVLIEEVSEALSKMEDGAQKSALAQDLFGKSGAKLIPLLNGGRQGLQEFSEEARKLNKVFTAEQGAAAERFNDNLDRLKDSITGIANVVAGQVVDDLARLTDTFADPNTQDGIANIASGLVLVSTKAVEALAAVGNLAEYIAESVARAANGIDLSSLVDVQDEISSIQELINNPITARLNPLLPTRLAFMNKDELIAEMEKLVKQRDDLINSYVPPMIPSASGGKAPETKKFTEYKTGSTDFIDQEIEARIKLQAEIQKSFDSQSAGYARQIALAGEVTELERVRYETSIGSLSQLDSAQKVILENQAKEIDQINIAAKAEADRKAIETKLVSDLEAARSSLLTQEEALREAAEQRFKVLEAGFMAGKIGEEEFAEQAKRNTELLDKQLEDAKNKTTELSEFTKELYHGVQNSIADAIVTGVKGGGENALEAFGDLLLRMAAEAAAANITQAIFGNGQTSGGGGGSGQGANTIGWVNMAASLFGGGLAVGGPAYAGKMYEVGENNNPELFRSNGRNFMIPGNGGSVVPANGGGNVIHINMPGITNAREGREAAGAVARKVSSAVAAGQRYS